MLQSLDRPAFCEPTGLEHAMASGWICTERCDNSTLSYNWQMVHVEAGWHPLYDTIFCRGQAIQQQTGDTRQSGGLTDMPFARRLDVNCALMMAMCARW